MKYRTLAQRWTELEAKKTNIYRRTEDYAKWTLPYIFPAVGGQDDQLNGAIDNIGARAVNHLSNKLIMTLFQPHAPFFRLRVDDEMLAQIDEAAKTDPDAKQVKDAIDKTLADTERKAMRKLDYNRYRPEATMAAKNLVVTGNALLYHAADFRVQQYQFRDYCVVRDLSGVVLEIITRDKKAFETLHEDVQLQIRAARKMNKTESSEGKDVTLYTQIKLGSDGKFHLKQSAEDVELDSQGSWTPAELPYIVLTWNLVRGEDYGRGLVEDYAGAFHALYVTNQSMVDLIGMAADIKYLVEPTSVLDVQELNNSPRGSYHAGKKDDVTPIQLLKTVDIQFLVEIIDRFERQIAQAFLLNSAVTRDAERVTAEEVRYVAQELELSHGGIYSRFAEEWQLRTAMLILKDVDLDIGKGQVVYPQIITGLDSLSRAGDLDNYRLFMQDMSLMAAVPEYLQAAIDPLRLAEYVGVRRGVDYSKFVKSREDMAAEQQAAQAQQEQAMAMQAGADVAVEGAKAQAKQEGQQ